MISKKEYESILASIPTIYKKAFEKAFSGASKATALKVKCLDCCCWQKEEVKHCQATSCPLWIYRPYQKK